MSIHQGSIGKYHELQYPPEALVPFQSLDNCSAFGLAAALRPVKGGREDEAVAYERECKERRAARGLDMVERRKKENLNYITL